MSTRPLQVIHFVATPARVAFRRTGGDVSRHLHTIWVAIETLAHSAEVRPPDLHLGWTKPSTSVEWNDTRDFATKAAMTSVLDGVDQYLKVLQRIPGLTDLGLQEVLKGTARTPRGSRLTIFARLTAVISHYRCAVTPEQTAAIELLATWRNQFVHGDYRHPISRQSRQILASAAPYFRTAQGGADIMGALARFDARHGPRFADLVTLITTCQLVIGTLDEHLIHLQPAAELAVAVTAFALRQDLNPPALLERLFSRGGRRSSGAVVSLLHRMGVAKTQGYTGSAPSLPRPAFDGVMGLGRNAASDLFGIPRS